MDFPGLKTSLFIAYKSVVKGNKSTLSLTLFILSLTFLNMMFVSGVLSGLSNSMVQTFIGISTAHITVSPQEEPRVKKFIPDQNKLRAEIETIPGVLATSRHYLLAGSLSYDKDKNGQYRSVSASVFGIDPEQEKRVLTVNERIVAGRYLLDADRDGIVLSSALAGGYGAFAPSDLGGVRVGDDVRVTYENGISRTYKVRGIYEDTLGIFETFITAKEAESILSAYNSASHILVSVDLSRSTLDRYESKVKAVVPNLKVQNYEILLGSMGSFIDALDLISLIVSTISLIVAAITIFVLIYVNAINRQRQIGILKAIGIKQDIIVNAYVIQSLFYSFCGVVVGSAAVFVALKPLLLAYPIPVISTISVSLVYTPFNIVSGISSFLGAGLLAGLVPSLLVARKDILKAIWG